MDHSWNQQKARPCAIELLYAYRPDVIYQGRSVAEQRYRMGRAIKEQLPCDLQSKFDAVVPIPRSGVEYGEGLAKVCGLPYLACVSKRQPERKTLPMDDPEARRAVLDELICVQKEACEGKRLLLVDEAVFTGATLAITAEKMRACGALYIAAAIPSPKVVHHCGSGLLKQKELVSAGRNDATLAALLGLDAIWFRDPEAFFSEMQRIGVGCCRCMEAERTGTEQ